MKPLGIGAVLGLGLAFVLLGQEPSRAQAPAPAAKAPGVQSKIYLPLVVRSLDPGAIVVVGNPLAYVDASGYAIVVGEAQNTTNTHFKWAKKNVNFFDAGHNLLGTSWGFIGSEYSGNFPAKSTTCFADSSAGPLNFSSYEFLSPTVQGPGRAFLSVDYSVSSAAYNPATHDYTVTGLLVNNTGTTLNAMFALATLHDGSGQVVGCKGGYTALGPYATGHADQFTITFHGRDYADVVSYRIQTDGTPPS